MKTLRTCWMCFPVAAGLCAGSGCATTSHDSYSAMNDGSGFEKRQASATENMTTLEKTGYYAGWFSLVSLYTWAGGNAPVAPP